VHFNGSKAKLLPRLLNSKRRNFVKPKKKRREKKKIKCSSKKAKTGTSISKMKLTVYKGEYYILKFKR